MGGNGQGSSVIQSGLNMARLRTESYRVTTSVLPTDHVHWQIGSINHDVKISSLELNVHVPKYTPLQIDLINWVDVR